MSMLADGLRPMSSCSGDMYRNVPRTLRNEVVGPLVCSRLAIPKSRRLVLISLDPIFLGCVRTMMFCGLTSRW